jgi:prophage regulatory protein
MSHLVKEGHMRALGDLPLPIAHAELPLLVVFAELRGPPYKIPYSRKHLITMRRAGEFPEPLQISANRVAWLRSDILSWIASRPRVNVLPAPPGRLNKAGRPTDLPARAKYAAKAPKPGQKKRGRPRKTYAVENARRAARMAKRGG